MIRRAAILALLALFALAGCTRPPYTRSNQNALGLRSESLGTEHTLRAVRLGGTWRFTRDARVVLEFGDGEVALDGVALEPGCYAGEVPADTVLVFEGSEGVVFRTPADDPDCRSLPPN